MKWKRVVKFEAIFQAIEDIKAKLDPLHSIMLKMRFPTVYGIPQMDPRIIRYGLLKFKGFVAFEIKEKSISKVREHIVNHNKSFLKQKQGGDNKLTINDYWYRQLGIGAPAVSTSSHIRGFGGNPWSTITDITNLWLGFHGPWSVDDRSMEKEYIIP